MQCISGPVWILFWIIVTKLLNTIEKYYRSHEDAPLVCKIYCTLHEALEKLEGDVVFISYSSPMVGD